MVGRAQSPDVGTESRRAPAEIEWPTLVVVAAVWSAYLALLVWHHRLPAALVVALFAVLGGWYMSVQHETLHGHPTPSPRVNTALAWVPLSLWLPFRVYRDSHLLHHEVELTIPGLDPESFYVSADAWAAAGPLRRTALRINRTYVGRLVVGPWLGIPATIVSGVRQARTDPSMRRTWLGHVPAAVVVGWIVFGVFDVPVWQYLIGYVWGGVSVAYIRSFAEHLPVPAPATRCAMVRSNPVMSLLFMNVNHHYTHHTMPGVAWYRLPQWSRDLDAEAIAAAGAGNYRGYWQIFCRYAVRPFGRPLHPEAEATPS
jgi:fatty acid desaturase